jgi:hypothetical protein
MTQRVRRPQLAGQARSRAHGAMRESPQTGNPPFFGKFPNPASGERRREKKKKKKSPSWLAWEKPGHP